MGKVARFLYVLAVGLMAPACSEVSEFPGRSSGSEPIAQIDSALLAVDTNVGLGGNEPNIAINPTNPQNIVVAQFRSVAISTNGGVSFGAPVTLQMPATHNQFSGGGDPVVAFDSQGRLFFIMLAQPVGATFNGPGGFDVLMQRLNPTTGAFLQPNGTACPGGCALSVSGAVGLAAGSDAAPGPGNADKGWMAIDTSPTSPFADRIYLVWVDFRGAGIVTTFSTDQGATWAPFRTMSNTGGNAEGFVWPPHIATATNGDVYLAYHSQPTFTTTALADTNGDGIPDSQVGEPDGSGQIVLFRSPASQTTTGTCPNPLPLPAGGTLCTGGVFDLSTRATIAADMSFDMQQCACSVAQATAGTCPNTANQVGWRPCPRALTNNVAWTQGGAQPYIVVDPGTPANVAVVYARDNSGTGAGNDGAGNDDMDVFIARSTNSGAPGSFVATQVPTGGAGGLQMFPHAAVSSSSACMSVAYYDDRNAGVGTGGSSLLDLFVMVSPDLGQTWLPQEVRINDNGVDQDTGGDRFPPPNPAVAPAGAWTPTSRIGEYFGLAHADGVAWTATNAAGAQLIRFDYSDGIPPVVTAPAATSVSTCLPTDVQLGTASATDTCGRPPLSTPKSNVSVSTPLVIGANTVTWSSTDGANNTGTATQNVTVTDNTGPFFTVIPPDFTTQSCTGVNVGTAFAQDDCGGTVTITNNAPARFALGTTTVTYTATDQRGNVRTATQRVTVLLGDDPACCPAGTNIIVGTSNNDVLNGTSGSDCIIGRGGQDIINGGSGNDFISGGDGDDTINGGLGNDFINGGSGQDVINGNDGDDTIYGGDGDDTLIGGAGNDILHGGQGQDLLQGQDGNDQLFGDNGDDNLQGGAGNDNLAGGSGQDHCDGGTGLNTFALCEFGAPNTCADGVQNGTETGLDCGGGCKPCATGGTCTSAGDCLGDVCAAGVCQTLLGGISVLRVVETDWGGGYCVHLDVTNVAASPTTNWTATLDTNQSTLFTSWNGNFSANSGIITVTPALASNQVIGPNATDGSIGFCANRNVASSGDLAFVRGATASY